MIVYCGLRHFYLRHFEPQQEDCYYILTHNKDIWDFSPELKSQGFTGQTGPQTIFHFDKPVLTVSINLTDFQGFASAWHDFSRQYTDELESEYPHAWYLRFDKPTILDQFVLDFEQELSRKRSWGIWGAASSKLTAKLAAHNPWHNNRIITSEQTRSFLRQIPLHRLPLPELSALEKLGVKTIGELADLPLPELSSQFGLRAHVLKQLGRGEDLIPFQSETVLEYNWHLDCTTLEGFLRPLVPSEFKPYLRQGLEKLAATLQEHRQAASELNLRVNLACGQALTSKRQFKEPSNDYGVLLRAAESVLPNEPLAQLNIVMGGIKPAAKTQLDLFRVPIAPKSTISALPAQMGMELSRRERLLMLWEVCFGHE